MSCTRFREVISASLDGEAADGEREMLATHLDQCAGCRRYEATASATHRQFRIAEVPAVPDLTAPILAAMHTPRATLRTDVLRALAAGLGVAKIAAAVGVFVAASGAHTGAELAAVDLAIGVGLLLAAWRPGRSAGLVPVLAVLAVATIAGGVADVAAGRVPLGAEAFHLFDALGAFIVWRLNVPHGAARRTRAVAV